MAEGSAQGAAQPPAAAKAPPEPEPEEDLGCSIDTIVSDDSECGFCQKGVHTGGSSAQSAQRRSDRLQLKKQQGEADRY